jgi:hypothetical protein
MGEIQVSSVTSLLEEESWVDHKSDGNAVGTCGKTSALTRGREGKKVEGQ